MKKYLSLLIGLLIISCESEGEDIIESDCPCRFNGRSTELFPVTSNENSENSGSGHLFISLSLEYPCEDYKGRSYDTNTNITFSYFDTFGNEQAEIVEQEAYSFTMNQEWINTINSSGSIDGFDITLRDCLESSYESN